jgi:pentatricopeptide repeat protein
MLNSKASRIIYSAASAQRFSVTSTPHASVRSISVRATRQQQASKDFTRSPNPSTPLPSLEERKLNLFHQSLQTGDFSASISLCSPQIPIDARLTLIQKLFDLNPNTLVELEKINTLLFNIAKTDEVGQIPNEYFKWLMKHFSSLNNVTRCQKLMQNILSHGIIPCQVTTAILLSIYAKNNLAVESYKFLQSALEYQLPLSTDSWSLVISAHKATPWKSLDILVQALDNGIPLNPIIAESCLNLFAKTGDTKGLDNIVQIMKTRKITFTRNAHHIIMNGYLQANKTEKAHDIFKRMDGSSSHTTPNSYTFNTMLKIHARTRDTEAASELLKTMRQSGCAPDVTTFNTLMTAFARVHNLESTLFYFNEMQSQELKPDVISWTILMGAYGYPSKDGLSKARETFNQMCASGCIPSQKTFNNLIEMHLKWGELGYVDLYHSQFLQRGMRYTSKILESVISAASSRKDFAKMEQLFKNAQTLRLTTTRMCTLIAVTFETDKVKRLDELIRAEELKPDAGTLRLMNEFAVEGDAEIIERVQASVINRSA